MGVVGLALAYTLVARAGLAMDAVSGFATLVWPPTGIALAALWLGGTRLWPGVLLGAFAVNVWIGAPPLPAFGVAIGNTLEALLAVWALRQVGFSASLTRVRDVMALVLLAAVASSLVSATIGVGSLFLAGIVKGAQFAATWRAWWIGDLIGDLLVAPVLLAWASQPWRKLSRRRARVGEALISVAALLAVAALAFATSGGAGASPFMEPFLLFPPLIWIALRFGPRGVSLASLLAATLAVAATVVGLGPFVRPVLHESLIGLQVFMAVTAITMLVLAAVVAERSHAESTVRESYSLLRAMIDGTTAPVYAKDRAGRVLLVNAAGAEVFGRPIAQLVGTQLAERDSATPEAEGKPYTVEETVSIKGRARTLLWTKGPYRDGQGEILGSVGIARDITEHKQTERALQQAVHARDEFMFIAGHELRTPLCTLTLELGSLERLGRRIGVDGKIMERVRKLLRQTDRLNHLIESLLEVTRLSTGRLLLKRETLDLGEVGREVVDRFAESAIRAECPLELHVQGDTTGQWDRLRVEQIVTNLVANAIKYGACKPVQVGITATASRVEIVVRDFGIGIAAEDISRIFGPFERAVSVRHFGGLGLGLYVTRQIAEAHGGTIRVASELGAGSTFVVTLPRWPDGGGWDSAAGEPEAIAPISDRAVAALPKAETTTARETGAKILILPTDRDPPPLPDPAL